MSRHERKVDGTLTLAAEIARTRSQHLDGKYS